MLYVTGRTACLSPSTSSPRPHNSTTPIQMRVLEPTHPPTWSDHPLQRSTPCKKGRLQSHACRQGPCGHVSSLVHTPPATNPTHSSTTTMPAAWEHYAQGKPCARLPHSNQRGLDSSLNTSRHSNACIGYSIKPGPLGRSTPPLEPPPAPKHRSTGGGEGHSMRIHQPAKQTPLGRSTPPLDLDPVTQHQCMNTRDDTHLMGRSTPPRTLPTSAPALEL